MKHFFFLILLTISGAAFSQKVFHVYDGFTLELIDSIDVSSSKKKVEVSAVTTGIYRVTNIEKGTQLMFTKPGYQTQSFECSDDKSSSDQIILAPSETVLKSYRAALPFYKKETLATDTKTTETNTEVTTDPTEKEPITEGVIASFPEEVAQFPGGLSELSKYLRDNIHYPQQALDLGISGKVYVQFVVSATGKISNVRVVRGANLPLDKESVRVVKNMPEWTPGYINGNPVNTYFNLPIVFKMQ